MKIFKNFDTLWSVFTGVGAPDLDGASDSVFSAVAHDGFSTALGTALDCEASARAGGGGAALDSDPAAVVSAVAGDVSATSKWPDVDTAWLGADDIWLDCGFTVGAADVAAAGGFVEVSRSRWDCGAGFAACAKTNFPRTRQSKRYAIISTNIVRRVQAPRIGSVGTHTPLYSTTSALSFKTSRTSNV